MKMRNIKGAIITALGLSTSFTANIVQAQAVDPATLQLFNEAITLMGQSNFPPACRKLEVVVQRYPQGSGAILELGNCYKGEGRLASAHAQYKEAAKIAQNANNSARAQQATNNAAALEPLIAKLEIDVPPAIKTLAGLKVSLDGIEQTLETWNKPFPIDAGKHVITTTAPEREVLETTVVIQDRTPAQGNALPAVVTIKAPKRLPTILRLDIPPELENVAGLVVKIDGTPLDDVAKWKKGETIGIGSHEIEVSAPGHARYFVQSEVKPGDPTVVTLKPLVETELPTPVVKPKPVPPPPPAVTPKARPISSGMSAGRIAGISMVTVGAVAGVAGIVLYDLALSKNDASKAYCPVSITQCTPVGQALRDDALTFVQIAPIVGFSGLALGALGTTFIIFGGASKPQDPQAKQTHLVVGPSGLRLQGSW